MSGEKKVICASTEFRSVADTPKHIVNISASSWLLSGKGTTSLLLLVWPAADVIISLGESLCSPRFSQPGILFNLPLCDHATGIDSV